MKIQLSANPSRNCRILFRSRDRGEITTFSRCLLVLLMLVVLIPVGKAQTQVVAWGKNGSGQCNVPTNLANVKAIAAGRLFSMALKDDGKVVDWGYADPYSKLPTNDIVVEVSAGWTHRLVLKEDGTVYTWDPCYNGTNVPGLNNVVSISAGPFNNLALKANGTVVSWAGLDINSGSAAIPAGLRDVVAISSGHEHSLALKADGTVVAWGNNGYGQTNVPPGLSNVVEIAAGGTHSLALKADGTLVSWGPEWCGDTNIPPGLTNVVAIAAGYYHNLVLLNDGTVVAWGLNYPYPHGVGLDKLTNVMAVAAGYEHDLALIGNSPPVITVPVRQRLSRVGAMVVMRPNILAAWPRSCQWLFNGTPLAGATNSALVLPSVRLDQAGAYSLIVSNAWGVTTSSALNLDIVPALITREPQGQTNLAGSTVTFTVEVESEAPVSYQWSLNDSPVPQATNSTLVLSNVQPSQAGTYSVAISNALGAAITLNAKLGVLPLVIKWQPENQTRLSGANAIFEVEVDSILPVFYQWKRNGAEMPGQTNHTLILSNVQLSDSRDRYSVLASNAAGGTESVEVELWVHEIGAWGDNSFGQVTPPAGLSNVVAVSAGENYSLALKSNGTVVAWGYDGDSRTDVPEGLSNVVAIAAGSNFGLALKNDSTVTGWGIAVPGDLTNVVAIAAGSTNGLALKADGQVVGLGITIPAGLTNIVAIAAGPAYCVAARENGTVVAWGDPSNGTLNVPADLRNVVAVAAGVDYSAALRSDGTVVGWGNNNSVPGNLANVAAIAAGGHHGFALKNDGTVVFWGSDSSGETNLPAFLNNIVGIAAGWNHSLAIAGNGAVRAFVLPADPVVEQNRSITLNAVVWNGLPIGYQWQFNGVNIPGANLPFLRLSYVQGPKSGLYSAIATTLEGFLVTNSVTLKVMDIPPPALDSRIENGKFMVTLRDNWETNKVRTVAVQVSTDMKAWSTVATLTNQSPYNQWIGPRPLSGFRQRFYRAVVQ